MARGRFTFQLLAAVAALAARCDARTFADAVRPVARIARQTLTAEELAAPIQFRISLAMPNLDELQGRLRTGQRVRPAELAQSYLPAAGDYAAVVQWLKGQGIRVFQDDPNHTTIYAEGSVSAVQAALHTRFVRGGTVEATTAATAPSLPDELAGRVLSITGLQPERRPKRIARAQPQIYTGDGTRYMTPLDVAAAYDLPAGLDGSGQTIALIEDCVSPESQYGPFWTLIGAAAVPSHVSTVTIGSTPLYNNAEDNPEVAVDIEWAGALAPGANLRVYAAYDIWDAIGAVLNDVVSGKQIAVMSVSYGGAESQYYDPAYSQTLAQLAAAGVTVVVAAGETTFTGGVVSYIGVNYPSSDPNVVSVGGTQLQLDANGVYSGEAELMYHGSNNGYNGTAYVSQSYTVATIAGPSQHFTVPSWQQPALTQAISAGVNGIGTGAVRVVPDVSAFAIGQVDGKDTFALDVDENGDDPVYGTSISCPVFAGFVALIAQERARVGLPALGAMNPPLYALSALQKLNLPQPLALNGMTGFQAYTGLGRPDVAELVLCLGDQFYAYAGQVQTVVAPGGTAAIDAKVSDASQVASYQWQMNTGSGWVNLADGSGGAAVGGTSFRGARTAQLVLTGGSAANAGLMLRAVVTTAAGAAAPTGPVTVAVGGVATPAPAAAVKAGSRIQLVATGSYPGSGSTLQWQQDGVALAGATGSTLSLASVGPQDAGAYAVVWTSPAGTEVIPAGTVTVTASDAKLLNLSARAEVAGGLNNLVAGFVVGSEPGSSGSSANKQLLITGKGPFLRQFGISDALAMPALTVYDGASKPIATEGAWGAAPVSASGSGASPLASAGAVVAASAAAAQGISGSAPAVGSADAMVWATLPPGNYSGAIAGSDGGTGVALAEVFDADGASSGSGSGARLLNLSARAQVGSGSQVLIAGFIIGGGPTQAAETVMLRAQGPNLSQYGVTGALPHARLTLYDGSGLAIASNDGWSNAPAFASGSGASPLTSAGAGLEPATAALQQQYAQNSLTAGSNDSAMVATLPPGSYTAIVDSPDGSAGIGLVELFEVR